jgi:hypothetical protein
MESLAYRLTFAGLWMCDDFIWGALGWICIFPEVNSIPAGTVFIGGAFRFIVNRGTNVMSVYIDEFTFV